MMQITAKRISSFLIITALSTLIVKAQLSPGDLSDSHSHLEGISNCTQCHILGNKVSNEKCLVCHVEIKDRIAVKKGYHSSSEVTGKECFQCHSEHNGKNFRLYKLDVNKFDHKLTGYPLSVPHSKKECAACHSAKFISDSRLKAKKSTYLGVNTECLNCHNDYHLRTLSSDCTGCHNSDRFTPASKFNHNTAKFQLAGKHINVECVKCHKISMPDGKKFQQFRGIPYNNCTSCHKDPHNNNFGQNCRKCHNENSFHEVAGGLAGFDHNKTGFKLEDKHLIVKCNSCHKTKFTDPLKHDKCSDCHADYHNRQFIRNGVNPDCSQCHTLKGFTNFTYTADQHNLGKFPLRGAHEAIPCFECHKKKEKWSFREIGIKCNECHKDIHKTYIQTKYYPDSECRICHSENSWNKIAFDHSKTGFILTGAHAYRECSNCHFRKDANGIVNQKFSGLSDECSACHHDNHFSQFEKNGKTDCTSCHGTDSWKAPKFDHNSTAFKLDGKHVNVPCNKCHKPQREGTILFIKYKIKEFKCESCHS